MWRKLMIGTGRILSETRLLRSAQFWEAEARKKALGEMN
jgi:hypothetical protein